MWGENTIYKKTQNITKNIDCNPISGGKGGVKFLRGIFKGIKKTGGLGIPGMVGSNSSDGFSSPAGVAVDFGVTRSEWGLGEET